jgi:hypothetical protein
MLTKPRQPRIAAVNRARSLAALDGIRISFSPQAAMKRQVSHYKTRAEKLPGSPRLAAFG